MSNKTMTGLAVIAMCLLLIYAFGTGVLLWILIVCAVIWVAKGCKPLIGGGE